MRGPCGAFSRPSAKPGPRWRSSSRRGRWRAPVSAPGRPARGFSFPGGAKQTGQPKTPEKTTGSPANLFRRTLRKGGVNDGKRNGGSQYFPIGNGNVPPESRYKIVMEFSPIEQNCSPETPPLFFGLDRFSKKEEPILQARNLSGLVLPAAKEGKSDLAQELQNS